MNRVAADDELVDHTTVAALEEKAKLKKHLGRFDMLFFLLCTLVGLDTLGPWRTTARKRSPGSRSSASSSSSRTRC